MIPRGGHYDTPPRDHRSHLNKLTEMAVKWYCSVTVIRMRLERQKSMSKRIAITLSDVKAKELEELAELKGVTKSVLVTMAIEEFLKKGERVEE